MARGPRPMAWLVARRELPPSLFSFLHGRTWSAPCFITFLTLLVSSPPRISIPSLLIQTRAQHFGRYARLLLFWLREAPSRGGTLARHSSSRSVKSSGGVFLAKQNPREAFFLAKHQALEKHISRGVHYLLARSICPLEVASGTCLERQIASRGELPREASS